MYAFFSLVVASTLTTAASFLVDYSNQNLTSLPQDIWENVTQLILDKNDIASLDSFPDLPDLYKVNLNKNLLETFPDLCIVGDTLKFLDMSNNMISSISVSCLECLGNLSSLKLYKNKISYLPPVTVMSNSLRFLSISVNELRELPDLHAIAPLLTKLAFSSNPLDLNNIFTELDKLNLQLLKELFASSLNMKNSDVDLEILSKMTSLKCAYFDNNKFNEIFDFRFCKNTLEILSFRNNPVTYIDMMAFRKYKKLRKLSCVSCKIITVPNACTINNNPPLIMDLRDNPFICDYQSKWLIPARDAGAVTLSDNPCIHPANLVSKSKHNLMISDFNNSEGKKIQISAKLLTISDFRCNAELGEYDVISGITPIECATLCTKGDKCLAAIYRENNKTCGLVSNGEGLLWHNSEQLFIIE